MNNLIKPDSSDEQFISLENGQQSSLEHHQLETKQKIALQGNDNSNTYNIFSRDCEITASKYSSEARINASNKIKVNRLVNYEWEHRYFSGNLIAVHKSQQYFAYALRTPGDGKVRVFHKKLNEKALIKSFKGRVVDLSFAHYDAQIILGCVEDTGCLQIFKISLVDEAKIETSRIFYLSGLNQSSRLPSLSTNSENLNDSRSKQSIGTPTGTSIGNTDVTTHRIIWCMYIPETPESSSQNDLTSTGDDASRVFVLARKNRADIFNLDMLEQNYDLSSELDVDELSTGHLIIDEHKATILNASFSPDGSAIATASSDGEVNFFKISFASSQTRTNSFNRNNQQQSDAEVDARHSSSSSETLKAGEQSMPRCLKKWKPHDNKPISSLYFLDDHKNPSADAQFWSFILTGADFNREIKIWGCQKWECLQTLRFYASPWDDLSVAPTNKQNPLPTFKTAIDLSSKYLVMSDITRKCFYVLHLMQDFDTNQAMCTAISEYLLTYPALSFAIIDTQKIKNRKFNQLNNVNATTATNTSGAFTSSSNAPTDEIDESLNRSVNDLINSSMASSVSVPGGEKVMSSSSNTQLNTTGAGPSEPDAGNFFTMIRLYCIQTKQLQEMQILLNGEQSINFYNSSISPPHLPPPQALMPLSSSATSLLSTSLTSNNTSSVNNLPTAVGSTSSSLLQQLLPNANLSPSLNNLQTQQQKQQQNRSFSSSFTATNSQKLSTSLNLGVKKRLSDANEPPKSSVSQTNANTSTLDASNKFNDDSAIIQIVAPTPININTLAGPILMTPDAFINSPNLPKKPADATTTSVPGAVSSSTSTTSASNANNQQKMDILQSFVNQAVNQSTSSHTSSLTQVTSATNLHSAAAAASAPAPSDLNLSNLNNSQLESAKQSAGKIRRRTLSSSSSSSTTSSSSSSSSSSFSSNMDADDKEIAATLSSTNKKQTSAKGKPKPKSSSNLVKNNNGKVDLLLNKVQLDPEMEHPSTKMDDLKNDDEQFVLTSKSFNIDLNAKSSNWPNPPKPGVESAAADSSSSNLLTGLAPSNEFNIDLKNLLFQMTNALRSQHEEIENLKKHQITSQLQLKSQIDNTLKQFLQQQQLKQSTQKTSAVGNHQQVLSSASLTLDSAAGSTSLFNDEQKIAVLIQQAINNSLVPKMDKLIKDEVSKCMQTQFVQRLVDPLREQMSRDLADKFKAIDNVIKEHLNKLFKSKTMIDSLSQSLSSSLQGTVVNSYRETFQKLIVPNFEKSCQNMYQQVNNSFSKGTHDYLSEFDTLAKQHKRMFDEYKEPIVQQMKLFSDQMQTHGKQVANDMATHLQIQFDNHLRNTNAILQDTIISSVKAIVKEEIHLAMRDQQHILPDRLVSYMRQSGTMTPVPGQHGSGSTSSSLMGPQPINTVQDAKTKMNTFLQNGQLNSAFQVALCAADLSLLMSLCEQVNPSQVFEPSVNNVTKKPQCQLLQPVILSLIQQLSQDLNSNIELKVKYLEEALVNLDLANALTREHTPSVINQLILKLQQYIQLHPSEKITKSLRMLLMASQSLLNQPKAAKSGAAASSSVAAPINSATHHHETF